jgi:phosphate transport system substrate-binding protein
MTAMVKGICRFSSQSIVVIFLLFAGSAAQGGHESLTGLAGPAFTEPLQTMVMTDDWKKQLVRHDSKEGKADLVISLGQQMYPAFSPIIHGYAREHNIKIIVYDGTCGLTAGKLSQKMIDIGGYCCPPGLTDRLPGLRFHTIGISAIALIVHRMNPVDSVTTDQTRKIFMGESYRWSELTAAHGTKGPNVPIQPVGRLHCKLRPGHWRLLLDNEDLFSPNLHEVGAIPDMISQVAGNERAIGYETLWMIHRFQQSGNVRALKIDGLDPNDQSSLLSGAYPFFRTYSLTTWEDASTKNPLAQKVVEYVLQQAEHIDRKFGLIPASRLREAGWEFYGDELTGRPHHGAKHRSAEPERRAHDR